MKEDLIILISQLHNTINDCRRANDYPNDLCAYALSDVVNNLQAIVAATYTE